MAVVNLIGRETAMFKGGYAGKILRINLTDKTHRTEPLPVEVAKNYIGGAGFGIKYLYDEVAPHTDPLGPSNKLIVAVGPLTGSSVPSASRLSITAKSPQTNAVGTALSGGHFPAELKFAGYDALIIEGKAEEPTYVSIQDSKVTFRSAKSIWGLKTSDCQQVIKDELRDQSIRCLCIGPAGENLSKMACIVNERRAAGRRGLGAVMGSKNLKAIAVKGTGTVGVADEEKFKAAKKVMTDSMKASPALYPVFAKVGSSCALVETINQGFFPTKNWTATGDFAPVEGIGLEAQAKVKVGKTHCHNCPVGCGQLMLASKGKYSGIMSEGPEFETQYSFGGQTGIDDLNAVIAADRLADELGLDSISAGVTIGFAMELFEKGIISTADTDGMEVRFGNDDAMIKLLQMIAFRQGIGDVLADGVKAAAERIGREAGKYALHVKGLELPAYDVRAAKAQGLNYATAYSGADHNKGYAVQEIFGVPVPKAVDRLSYEGKGELCKWNQDDLAATADCPILCSFVVLMSLVHNGPTVVADLITGLTGVEMTGDEVFTVGERVNNLCKAFNVREGFTRADDCLPERLMTEPIPAGPSKGAIMAEADFNGMLDDYYMARGWDKQTGIPTRNKLIELGLTYVADQLNI
ncbi:MAG: aldehyde ferredoxin oxidoreductase family protein [Deferrisomatales bacterium]